MTYVIFKGSKTPNRNPVTVSPMSHPQLKSVPETCFRKQIPESLVETIPDSLHEIGLPERPTRILPEKNSTATREIFRSPGPIQTSRDATASADSRDQSPTLESLCYFPSAPDCRDSCDDWTMVEVTPRLWYCPYLVLSNRLVGRSRMAIQLTPTRIKGSKYLLIPKDLAQLLEIDDKSILNLTIEETSHGQRLVYSIQEKHSNATHN